MAHNSGLLARGTRRGFQGLLTLKGDKEILISSITSIQFKKAGFIHGYIQFGVMGGNEAKVGDENTVMFSATQQPEFDHLKKHIENQLHQPTANVSSVSAADEIAKLAALRDRGVLSELEFQQQKKIIFEQKGRTLSSAQPVRANVKQQNQLTPSNILAGCGCSVIAFLALLVVVPALFGNRNGDGDRPQRDTVHTGEIGVLRMTASDDVVVASSQAAYDRLVELSVARDNEGIMQLMIADLAWTVPNGTKCRVINPGIFVTEARILDGESAGRLCFVAAEWVTSQ